jgi:REase_MTES_1575
VGFVVINLKALEGRQSLSCGLVFEYRLSAHSENLNHGRAKEHRHSEVSGAVASFGATQRAVECISYKVGYTTVAQVGESGFRIDLAVVNSNPELGYILGIECDGKAYHSEWSARARDVWRQQILEKRGWKIHRVWSTNWWLDRDGEIRKLVARIKSLGGN